jgi:Methylamine utilisation protein MauE
VRSGGAARAVADVLRFAIAAVLLASAAGKLLDVGGFGEVLRSYRALPEGVVRVFAAGVPVLELGTAAWLASGRRLLGAAAGSAVMHAVYAAWSAAAVLRGLRLSNCGCFGVYLPRPLTWATVAEDLALVLFSLVLYALARRNEPATAAKPI